MSNHIIDTFHSVCQWAGSHKISCMAPFYDGPNITVLLIRVSQITPKSSDKAAQPVTDLGVLYL